MLGSLVVVGPVVALVVGYLAWRRRATEALVLLAGTVLTVIASNTAKAAIDRPRPNGSLVETASSSFRSPTPTMAPRATGRLYLRLVNNDGDTLTQVTLQSVAMVIDSNLTPPSRSPTWRSR